MVLIKLTWIFYFFPSLKLQEKPKGFVGFSGFGASTKTPTAAFSFLNKPTTLSTELKAPDNGENGSAKPVMSEENSSEKEYLASLRVLNETVSSWITEHVKKNPCCVLTPIFQDYEKHLKDLELKRKETKSKESTPKELENASKPPVVPLSENFKFGALKNETSKSNSGLFSSSTPISTAATVKAPFSFSLGSNSNLNTSATPASFSFATGKPAFSSAPPFSFATGTPAASSSTPSFSFSFSRYLVLKKL